MDPDPPSSTPRKVKYPPKRPPRRPAEALTNKAKTAAEDNTSEDEAGQQTLLRRVQDLTKRGKKPEKKSSVEVVFSHGASSTTLRTFGRQRETTNDGIEAVHDKESVLVNEKISFTPPQTSGTEVGVTSADSVEPVKKIKEYKEPWDYECSNYPVTLPLRRPYSGDPELLDEAEFGNAVEYDENSLCSARVLGLMDQDDSPRMLLFQLPDILPLAQESTSASGAKGKEKVGSSTSPRSEYAWRKDLAELPGGYIGKMLVYKSGSVKLKLGDILFDVSPGSDCDFAQNVVSINAKSGHCCELGSLTKRAVVSPDVDSLVENVP